MKTLEIDEKLIKKWQKQGTWVCEVCGCTEARGCIEGCHWVEENLCSVCFDRRLDLTPEILRTMENIREQINSLYNDAVCFSGDTFNFGWTNIETHLSNILMNIDSIEMIIQNGKEED